MTDWDAYARSMPHDDRAYRNEPVQAWRARGIVARCTGSVLDVGSSDGWIANLIRAAGHEVRVVDVSAVRVARARERYGLPGDVADAAALPYPDDSYDTVVLGEILEHMENPGPAFTEACRVSRERVIISIPTRGWADPTHQWRIRVETFFDERQRAREVTKGEQVVLTWQRGACWPPDYVDADPSWRALFG